MVAFLIQESRVLLVTCNIFPLTYSLFQVCWVCVDWKLILWKAVNLIHGTFQWCIIYKITSKWSTFCNAFVYFLLLYESFMSFDFCIFWHIDKCTGFFCLLFFRVDWRWGKSIEWSWEKSCKKWRKPQTERFKEKKSQEKIHLHSVWKKFHMQTYSWASHEHSYWRKTVLMWSVREEVQTKRIPYRAYESSHWRETVHLWSVREEFLTFSKS